MTITVSEATVEALRDLVANVFEDAQVRYYSGRGMFSGDVCLGLVCDGPDELVRFVIGVTRTLESLVDEGDGDEDVVIADELGRFVGALEDGLVSTRQDVMGTQVVYYWPGVGVTA